MIAESPVITLAGIKWVTSLCELWELVSSWLTVGSLPASWRFILYMHVSVFSKDSGVPLCRFGVFSSCKFQLLQTLWEDSISVSSPQLSRSSELYSGLHLLLHSLSYASRHKVRAVIRLALFVSILSGITDLVCLLSNVWKLFHTLSNFPVIDSRIVNKLPVFPLWLEAEVISRIHS